MWCEESCQISAPMTRFPYIASVRGSGKQHLCIGILIKDRLVLAPASCVEAAGPNPVIVLSPGSHYEDGAPMSTVLCTFGKTLSCSLSWHLSFFLISKLCHNCQIYCIRNLEIFIHKSFRKSIIESWLIVDQSVAWKATAFNRYITLSESWNMNKQITQT